MPNPNPAVPPLSSEMRVHIGEVVYSLAMNTYASLLLTLVECIQNALDAGGLRILVGIDLKSGNVIITDNGLGVTKERFDLALASVGHGVKSEESLGRFGKGLIAPLNKCKQFIFISQAIGQRKALKWTFEGEKIRKQHYHLEIPCSEMPRGLPGLPAQMRELLTDDYDDLTWRTIVMMKQVTKSKVISLVDLDELEATVRARFSQVMYNRGASVRVLLIDDRGHRQVRDINPVAYSGERLDEVVYTDSVAGEVSFKLYRTAKRSGARSGGVIVSQLDRPQDVLPMKDFTNQARASKWREVVMPALEALGSGYFEGTISCKNIELHEGRKKFVWSDGLETLYLLVATWYDEYGKAYFDDEQEATREERYQLLGSQSQQRLRQTLMRPEYSRVWAGLRSVVANGRLGQGHLKPEHGRPDGTDLSPTIRSGQGGAGTPKSPSGRSNKPSVPSEGRDRPGDIPTGAAGPRGQRRRLVKNDSQGLWFEYSWMEGNSRLWEFDFNSGVMTFNVRHPIWTELDETKGRHTKRNDTWIMELQEWLAFEMLCMLANHPSQDAFDEHRRELDTRISPYVHMFILPAR